MVKIGLGISAIFGSIAGAKQGIKALMPQGPQCVVDVIGADLNARSDSHLDGWTLPDVKVECRHGSNTRSTQTEFNSLDPRFLFSSKMPYKAGEGFAFTVIDVDITSGDEVIGRAYVNAERAKQSMKDGQSILLSLGDGIGKLKVRIGQPEILKSSKSLDTLELSSS